MKNMLLIMSVILTTTFNGVFGQITFQRVFSGPESEWAGQTIECKSGGYAILGTTRSFGAGMDDICLIKTDVNGEILWSKTYGGPMSDYCSSFQETPDGGFIIVGYTFSFGAGGASDIYVIRVNSLGEEIWSKVFHGDSGEQPISVVNSGHDGFVVAGHTRSFGSGNKDYFLLGLDAIGDTTWAKAYGKEDIDDLYSLEPTDDGGYIAAGGSGDFDPTGSNVHLMKTNSIGDTLWTKAYHNESTASIGFSAKQTSDGGYIIGAYSGEGFTSDYYVIRTDAEGDTLWTRTYTPSWCADWCKSIRETEDGGFIMSGYSECLLGIITIKIDADGNVLWDQKYDGLYNNTRIETTSDNGFLMLTWDTNDDTGFDMRIVKTDENGISGCLENTLSLSANITSGLVKSGPVTISSCPWEIVEPTTITGLAAFTDTTDCYSCDSVTANFDFEVIDGEVVFTNLSGAATDWSWDFGNDTESEEQHPTTTYIAPGTYLVCLVSSNPYCGEDRICKEITIEFDNSGIADERNNNISIYPNPTKNELTFNANEGTNIESLRILTITGQCVFDYNLVNATNITIELKDLSRGIYISEVHTDQGILIKKIIRN